MWGLITNQPFWTVLAWSWDSSPLLSDMINLPHMNLESILPRYAESESFCWEFFQVHIWQMLRGLHATRIHRL